LGPCVVVRFTARELVIGFETTEFYDKAVA